MDKFIDGILYTLPSIIIVILVYIFLDNFLKKEKLKKEYELKISIRKEIIPIKLQAYERMTIFLERIRPVSLVRRINEAQTIKQLEFAYIEAIQQEFDHNLSQQIYINPETWKMIFSAKNATQNFIKQCCNQISLQENIQKLQEEIITKSINENNPSDFAMIYLQKDIQEMM